MAVMSLEAKVTRQAPTTAASDDAFLRGVFQNTTLWIHKAIKLNAVRSNIHIQHSSLSWIVFPQPD
jgi:hypothetical protein